MADEDQQDKAGRGGARTPYEVRLESDNFKLRERIRTLRADVETAKSTAAPAGAVVLTGEDAKTYEAFKALNLAPAAIADRLQQGDRAAATLAENDRVKAITDAVTEAGFKGSVLADLAKQKGFTVALKETTVDGKKVSVPFAQKLTADGTPDGSAVPLEEYVGAHLADYAPALKAPAEKGTQANAPARTAGPAFPGNPANGTHGTKPKTAQQIAEQKRASGVYTSF